MSPDPSGSGAASLEAPQTWNRYAYVNNNPLSAVDPLGLLDDPSCKVNDIGCGGAGSGGMDNGGAGVWAGAGGYSGAASGAGLEACGIDSFCIQKGGIGPFGSPVAQVICDATGCHAGSWVNSTYQTGGDIDVKTPAPKGLITINCSVDKPQTSADCTLADYTSFLVINDGSHQINPLYPGLAPGDIPVGSNIWQPYAKTWNGANNFVTLTSAVTATIPIVVVASPAAPFVYTVAVNAAGSVEAGGLSSPFVLRWLYNVASNPTSLVISIENNLNRAKRVFGW
jgi:hypothetical protein